MVEGRGEEKRCFSVTRTGANSFLIIWWKGGVKRNGVSLSHVPEPIVFLIIWWKGGVERNGVFLPHLLEPIVF
jgi:hypothetical protein